MLLKNRCKLSWRAPSVAEDSMAAPPKLGKLSLDLSRASQRTAQSERDKLEEELQGLPVQVIARIAVNQVQPCCAGGVQVRRRAHTRSHGDMFAQLLRGA